MAKATWNGVVVAGTPDTVVVESNHYFPLAAVDPAMLRPSATTSVCPWKGTAHYYTLAAGHGRPYHVAVDPPSTTMIAPVM